MRVEKKGFVLHLEGTWLEISNKYGVLKYGDIEAVSEVTEDFMMEMLDDFIAGHSVKEFAGTGKDYIKRVAFDAERNEYIQLQAIRPEKEGDSWLLQRYDNELIYMGEELSGCVYYGEMLEWMRENYEIAAGLPAYVFRSSLGDCTNRGISSARKELYIISSEGGPFEPQDIRECVYIEWREIMGGEYIDCKPLYFPKRWYMAGGNFLYTSDSRFKEITRSSYPLSIHDRYEGK